MVLQILPYTRTVCDHIDPMLGQMGGGADAGEHQEFRGVNRRCRQYNLALRTDDLDRLATLDLDAHGTPLFDHHALRQRADQRHIPGFLCRPQVGIGRRPAPPVPDRLLHRAKAFLLLAVVILGHLVPGLRPSLHKGVKQRVRARPTADMQRPVLSAPCRIPAMAVLVPRLHAFVIGQHVGIAPALRAAFLPMIEVLGMAAHIDHAIDR